MNTLVPITFVPYAKETTARVNARQLHKALGVGKRFASWIAERIKEYGFTEGLEFFPSLGKTTGKVGRPSIEYQLTLGMAKELAMVERNDKGREIRRYFIEIEDRVSRGDVTLADEIADKATPQQQEWLARRTAGKAARGQFVATLAAHGVAGKGYADCTNAIYRHVIGAKKSEICAARNLPRTANMRDLMDLEQLTRTALAEIVAKKRIERFNVHGNNACAYECDKAAAGVAAIN